MNNIEKNSHPSGINLFLMKRIPMYYLLLLMIPLTILSYSNFKKHKKEVVIPVQNVPPNNTGGCSDLFRGNTDTSLVRPILFVEGNNEDANLLPVKQKIITFIEQKKKEGVLTSASVYLKHVNKTDHIEINPDEYYSPASILKIVILLQYLEKAENNPDLLNSKIFFKEKFQKNYTASITNKTITEGNSYTIADLLYYTIVYSDNQAFWLLDAQLQNGEFQKFCLKLGIPYIEDQINRSNGEHYLISNVNSISRLFRVLYNCSLVNRKLSDYGIRLLLKSDYKDGLLRGIDKNVRVAHKFGERGENGIMQLHEFGIVYLKDNPYTIGVMTKGKDKAQLADVIAAISKITYDELRKN